MKRGILPVVLVSMIFIGACEEKSQVSSHKTKVYDEAVRDEIINIRQNTIVEMDADHERFVPLMLALQNGLLGNDPDRIERFSDMNGAMIRVLEERKTFQRELLQYDEKILVEISNASSKEELMQNIRLASKDLKAFVVQYEDAVNGLIQAMQEAGIDSPVMDEYRMDEGE